MAHAVRTRNFGRNKSWRKATVRSLAQALINRERIETTWAKAKETQRITERLITLGKKGSLHARRRAQSILNDVDGVRKLFTEIAPRFQNRAGGYTRVLRLGHRAGDAADMAWIELVELGVRFQNKPKNKAGKETKEGKESATKTAVKEKPRKSEEEKPRTSAKPAVKEKAEVKDAEIVSEEPSSEAPKKEKESPDQKSGFTKGLRQFFKRRGDTP